MVVMGTMDEINTPAHGRTTKTPTPAVNSAPSRAAAALSQAESDRLQAYASLIRRQGPHRVVVDADGYTVTPLRATREYGRTRHDVIFIRSDGWSLAASSPFIEVAERLWSAQWIGVLKKGADRAEPIVRTDEATS